jgi:PPOX class probable F420-dependent enzyme
MALAELADERYVSLTTFRKDGTPVATPVWVAGDDGRLLVVTGADSWKVRRIRHDPRVRVAPCTGLGKLRGDAVDAQAEIVADTRLVEELEDHKYGWQKHVAQAVTGITRWIRRQPAPGAVMLVITDGTPPDRDGPAAASR